MSWVKLNRLINFLIISFIVKLVTGNLINRFCKRYWIDRQEMKVSNWQLTPSNYVTGYKALISCSMKNKYSWKGLYKNNFTKLQVKHGIRDLNILLWSLFAKEILKTCWFFMEILLWKQYHQHWKFL